MPAAPPLPPRPGGAAAEVVAAAGAADRDTWRRGARGALEAEVGGGEGYGCCVEGVEVEEGIGWGDSYGRGGDGQPRVDSGEVPAAVVLPRPLSIVKRRSVASWGEETGAGSVGTAVPGTPRLGCEVGGTPSPPLRVRRVRPRALRGKESVYSLRTVSPALSSQDVSFSGEMSGWQGQGSLLGVRGHAPYVLVPSVTVTPEVEVVADGDTMMWVAVEVGAQLGRPDGAGVVAGWNGWGGMPTDLSEWHAGRISAEAN